MNVLVTGANGQLGSHLRILGEESQHRYFYTDVDELDITRRDAVLNYVLTNGINVVVNCAAYTNVDRAEDEEATAELVNSVAVRHLADAMKVVRGTMVHISTDYVFGGNGYNTPCREDAALNPTGAYGRTKMHGEEAIADVGCHFILIRTGWLYSEYGKNFVKTMLRIFSEKETCRVVFDQVGTPTYAGDLARVIFDMVENESFRGRDGIYHFSNEGVCSWYDFALEIARQAGNSTCKIMPCHSNEFPSKVNRPPYSVLDKTKIKQTFGIEIPHWTASLSKCLQNIKQ
jgi:dTDP-4-dehydrorhamnose reductase